MPSNVTSWRANMKIGTGPPGHYESEIVSSNWCDTREKAEAEAKKIYENEHSRDQERYRRTYIEERSEREL
jgi:hypothetical protein